MFDNFAELFELIKGFFAFGQESAEFAGMLLPGFVYRVIISFFLLLGIVAVIKLIKGLVSLIGGIASGFIA